MSVGLAWITLTCQGPASEAADNVGDIIIVVIACGGLCVLILCVGVAAGVIRRKKRRRRRNGSSIAGIGTSSERLAGYWNSLHIYIYTNIYIYIYIYICIYISSSLDLFSVEIAICSGRL